ncbi:MAG: fatty acid desaturase [Pseudomonadota bacterium]|nr:fatty acid desaturase [Pseudomonadota bacterium]
MSTPQLRMPKVRSNRSKSHLFLFRYSGWDAFPAALLFLQFALIIGFVFAWPHLGWPARIGFGVAYALSVGWCVDTVAHNFVHNPFFASEGVNRIARVVLSAVIGTPQTGYAFNHMRHHAGSSDRPGDDGATLDPISLYQYGADGKAEPVWRYALLQYWRDESALRVIARIRERRPVEADQARRELFAILVIYVTLLLVDWQAMLFLAPCFYLGQCFSSLIAYYEHFGADPETPMATGVSTYAPAYNWLFFNNGFHNEHHLRPKQHWSAMKALREETMDAQSAAGAKTIAVPHYLGFLEPWTRRVPTAWR